MCSQLTGMFCMGILGERMADRHLNHTGADSVKVILEYLLGKVRGIAGSIPALTNRLGMA